MSLVRPFLKFLSAPAQVAAARYVLLMLQVRDGDETGKKKERKKQECSRMCEELSLPITLISTLKEPTQTVLQPVILVLVSSELH